MGFEIKDGTGTGNLARVDSENKLAVRAVQETEFEKAVLGGRAFNINTEFLTITSDTEHALLYLKNNVINAKKFFQETRIIFTQAHIEQVKVE